MVLRRLLKSFGVNLSTTRTIVNNLAWITMLAWGVFGLTGLMGGTRTLIVDQIVGSNIANVIYVVAGLAGIDKVLDMY